MIIDLGIIDLGTISVLKAVLNSESPNVLFSSYTNMLSSGSCVRFIMGAVLKCCKQGTYSEFGCEQLNEECAKFNGISAINRVDRRFFGSHSRLKVLLVCATYYNIELSIHFDGNKFLIVDVSTNLLQRRPNSRVFCRFTCKRAL
jgi:hypothetical protein